MALNLVVGKENLCLLVLLDTLYFTYGTASFAIKHLEGFMV